MIVKMLEKLNYLKKYSSLKDWNENIVCRLCLQKIEANKTSKKILTISRNLMSKNYKLKKLNPNMSKKIIHNKNSNTKNLIEEETIQNFGH